MFLSTAVAHYTAAAASDCGRKRPSNEDAFGFSVEHGVYVVCDGMGGAAAGEVASSLAVDEMMRLLTSRDADRALVDDAEAAVASANASIFMRARNSRNLSGMGTTLVSLLAEQITLDHSLVEEQVRLGRMDRLEAQRSPFKNVITRALGTQSSVTPDVFELETEPGELFLLCSDGLTRELSDAVIEWLLKLDLPLQEMCARLVAAANDAGGHDNITCLLVRAEA